MARVLFLKVSSQSALFLRDADMRLFVQTITTEIGSKYGPFDFAMIPIWRGGTFSFIARLGFRVRFCLPSSHFDLRLTENLTYHI